MFKVKEDVVKTCDSLNDILLPHCLQFAARYSFRKELFHRLKILLNHTLSHPCNSVKYQLNDFTKLLRKYNLPRELLTNAPTSEDSSR